MRKYGNDYTDRLISAGFNVTSMGSDEVATPDEINRMHLTKIEKIFCCTK